MRRLRLVFLRHKWGEILPEVGAERRVHGRYPVGLLARVKDWQARRFERKQPNTASGITAVFRRPA